MDYTAAEKAQRKAKSVAWHEMMLLSAWTQVIVRMDRLQKLGALPDDYAPSGWRAPMSRFDGAGLISATNESE